MTELIPLGAKESLHLEFKGREALKKPEAIAREVVALLNAEGGTVWVGLRDEGDRAVAVEPIPDAERERRRLRDFLVDTIEPSPAGEELVVDVVDAETGAVLQIRACPREDRRPYAHLKEGGRWFVVRIGDRNRPMARDEIFAGVESRPAKSDEEQAARRLFKDREALLESREEVVWLGIQPVRNLDLDLQEPRLGDVLRNPGLSGNRRSGYHFIWPDQNPSLKMDRLVSNKDQKSAEVWRHGGLRFQIPLKELFWPARGDLWPPALLEYPIAAFRMAGAIYREIRRENLRSTDVILADLAMIGARGTRLRAGSQANHWYGMKPQEFDGADDFLAGQPFRFSAQTLVEHPDLCGFRMIERIYEAYGLKRDDMPLEFDQKAGRLVLPE